MAKLSSFLTDTVAVNDGMWVRVNEALYDDLEIQTRGFTDKFVDAQAARQRKARLDDGIADGDALPNATSRKINASLLRDFLVIGVRNLQDDAGADITLEAFHDLLDQAQAARLARACWEAAAKASTRTAASTKDAVGN